MNIELKEIDKDTLKVGDWVGVEKGVRYREIKTKGKSK